MVFRAEWGEIFGLKKWTEKGYFKIQTSQNLSLFKLNNIFLKFRPIPEEKMGTAACPAPLLLRHYY